MPLSPSAAASLGSAPYTTADWNAVTPPPVTGDRPVIRPPVGSPLSAGRRGGSMASFAGDQLGTEENEYDSPAYLRRRPSHEMSAQGAPAGMRLPGET
jgi:hypothetical protein